MSTTPARGSRQEADEWVFLGPAVATPDSFVKAAIGKGWARGPAPSFVWSAQELGEERTRDFGEAILQAVIDGVRPLVDVGLIADVSSIRSMGDLAAEVEKIRHQIDNILNKLEEWSITKTTALLDLGTATLSLLQPLPIVVTEYEEEVVASWPEVEAFGSGDSDSEAIRALKHDIVDLYDDLCSTQDSELGSMALGWKETLQKVIIPHGTSQLQSSPSQSRD